MKPFSDDALEMAIDRIGYPNSPREAAGVFTCADHIMFDFVVPSEQAFDWLDSLEYIRKSRALAEAQDGELGCCPLAIFTEAPTNETNYQVATIMGDAGLKKSAKYNAHLISAATNLYAALERFVSAAESWHNFHNHTDIQCDSLCACIEPGKAALAKAHGEEPKP